MKQVMIAAALMWSSVARAAEPPTDIDWRTEGPGWGMGLQYGPYGPGASLRGWSSPALSVDVEGSLMRHTQIDSVDAVGAESNTLSARFGIAPRVRVFGSAKTDVFVVPSVAVRYDEATLDGEQSRATGLTAAAGVAVDRWFAPGVSFTGRIDLASLGFDSAEVRDQRSTSRSTGLNLTPSVAIHVYPQGLGRRSD